MPITFYEVAKLAGVSTATVSRVINDKGNVSPQAADRVMAAVKTLGYYPNASAKSLAGAGTRTIGMVLPPFADLSFPDSYTLDFLNGVQTVLAAKGYSLLILDAKNDPPAYFDAFREKRIEGLIALESMVEGVSCFDQMRESRFPVVLVSEFGKVEGISRVDVDIARLFESALDILKARGRERICMAIYDHRPASESARYAAAQKALNERYPNPGSKVLYTFGLRFGLFDALLEEMKAGGYDAFFADSPYIVRRIAEAAREAGLKVPGDLSILSLDYTGYETNLIIPPIDALVVPSFTIGATAAEFIFSLLKNGLSSTVKRIEPSYVDNGSIATKV